MQKNSHNVFFTFRIWNVFFTFSAYVFFTFSDRGGVGGCRRFLHVFFKFSLRFLDVFFTFSLRILHVFFTFPSTLLLKSSRPPCTLWNVFFTFSLRFLHVFFTFSLRFLEVFFACSFFELARPLSVFFTFSMGTETAVQNPKKTLTAFFFALRTYS